MAGAAPVTFQSVGKSEDKRKTLPLPFKEISWKYPTVLTSHWSTLVTRPHLPSREVGKYIPITGHVLTLSKFRNSGFHY